MRMQSLAGIFAPCIGCVAVFAASIAVIGCGGSRSERFREEAETALHAGNGSDAERLYRMALEADGGNKEAQLGLGLALEAQSKTDEAVAELKKAFGDTPAGRDAYWECAHVLQRAGRDEEAAAIADEYMTLDEEQGTRLKGRLLLAQGAPDEALTLLTSAEQKHPSWLSLKAEIGLAELASGQTDAAESQFRTVVTQVAQDAMTAWMGLAEAKSAERSLPELIDELDRIGTTAVRSDLDAVRVQCLLETGKAAEAEQLGQEMVSASPLSPWANYALGKCLLERGSAAEALPFLRRARAALPREFFVQRALDEAFEAIVRKDVDVANETSGGAEAAWKNQWRQARLFDLIEHREAYLAEGGSHVRETLIAAAILAGRMDVASALSKDLPQDSPLGGFVEAYTTKNAEGVIKSLEPWLNRKDELAVIAQNLMGHAMSVAGTRARALQVLWGCRNNFPDNAVSLWNSGQAFRLAQMPLAAAKVFEQLISQAPENPEGYVLQCTALREGGSQDEARQVAQTAFAIFPEDPEVVINLAQAYLDAREPDEAERILRQAVNESPDMPRLTLNLAGTVLRQGNTDECLAILTSLPESADAPLQTPTLRALAFAAKGDWTEVSATAGSYEGMALLPIARMLQVAGDAYGGALDKVGGYLKRDEGGAPVGGWAGEVLLRASGVNPTPIENESLEALAQLVAESPESVGRFAYAVACQMGDLHDEALQVLEEFDLRLDAGNSALLAPIYASLVKAFRVGDIGARGKEIAVRHSSNPDAWLGLAGIYYRLDDQAAQRTALDEAATVGSDRPDVFLKRGMFFEGQGEYEAAIEEYRKALTLKPDDPIGNNNLAYALLSLNGDPNEALQFAQRAVDAAPHEARFLHTLGVAELRSGNLEDGEKHLGSALERMPGEPTLLLDYGLLLVKQGKVQEGRAQVEAARSFAMQFGLDFPRRNEAEELLQTIPAPKPATGAAPTA